MIKNKLKSEFPRNFNIEKKYKEIYNKLELTNDIFKGKGHKDIFMFALAMGYKLKLKTKLVSPVGLINCESFSDDDVWSIASVAISDKNLSVLNDITEIRKIAEEYANAGFEILQKKLFREKPGSIIKHFESELLDLLSE